MPMDKDKRPLSKNDQTLAPGGVRTPLKGESSSTGIPVPGDAPTVLGSPGDANFGSKPRSAKFTPPPFGEATQVDNTYVEQPMLEEGRLLAQRYEILSMLGVGGMGAVYKARDVELDRMIALKIIRRDLAGNRAIIDRFKQELILATQVTHRNVIRIYDLGEAEGMKFITMEFVEGMDLRTLIHERSKLPPEEAVGIIEQSCRALEAAHNVGVIHRDLKPQNIMQETSGRIVVMDFGLARTLEGDGMTQSGAMVGTMEYMSPEQALAKPLDQRSDIFSLGLIFYELLTGQTPFKADSALASLIMRTQQRVVPVSDFDKTVPPALSEIVSQCLERDVELRYQSAAELLADLAEWQGKGGPSSSIYRPSRAWRVQSIWLRNKRWWLVGAALVSIVIGALGYKFVSSRPIAPGSRQEAAAKPALSLAILPFHNSSGEAKDDWIGPSLSDMLSTDVGQSAHLHTVSTDRLHQVLSDLRVGPQTAVDPDTQRRVAEFSGADVIVSGQYARFGDQIVIDGTIRDLKRDQTVPIKAQALEKDLPAAIDSLADSVRKNLSLSSDLIDELKAQSFKPNSKSVPALRDYNEGLALLREGKNLDAYKHFLAATGEDPQFALALSRLGEVQAELGFEADSERSSRQAVELAESQNLPLPVKYLINASHAQIIDDKKKAIESYENLSKSLPGDTSVLYDLGMLYLETGAYDKSRSMFAQILKADPKNIKALWGMGVVENTVANPQAALDALTKGLSLATQVDNQEQKALMLLSIGISYRLLNKPQEALRNYQESIAINTKIGKKRGVAAAFDEMADFQAMNGQSDAALASYNKALALLREIGAKKETGDSLMDMGTVYQDRGDYDQALDTYKQALAIQRDQGDQHFESQCLHNIAAVYLEKGDADNAFTFYQQALLLRQKLGIPGEIAETMAGLGEAYITTGQYDDAMKSLMGALEFSRKTGDDRRAALVSHQMGLVFEYQGRYGAAVKSIQEAVKSLREQGEHGRDLATSLVDLANSLAQAGRGDEAVQPLSEAEQIARALKNDGLVATILNTRGNIAFYRGDISGANQSYQAALRLASKAKDADAILESKVNVAEVAMAQNRDKEAVTMLRPLIASSEKSGANLSLRAAVALAQAEVGTKNYPDAERDLEQNLTRTEKAGMRLESARIYYLLGTSTRLSGSPGGSSGPYREAIRLFNLISYDQGAEKFLSRVDIKAMYDDANRWVGNPAGQK
jgi:eukaryotic-like serine/threonine-protein kinase